MGGCCCARGRVGSGWVGSGHQSSQGRVEGGSPLGSGHQSGRSRAEGGSGRVGSKITSRITMVIRLVILGVRVDHPPGSPIGLGNQHHHGSPVGSRLSRGWVGSGSCRGRVEGGRVGLFLFQDSKNSRDVTRANRSFARTKTNHSPYRRGPFVCMSQNVHHQNQRRPKPFVSMPKPFPPTIKTTNNQPYDQHHQHPPINNQPHGGVDHTKVVHLFPCPKTFHSPFDVYHPTP